MVKKKDRSMSIWRVDLMTDVSIPEFDEQNGKFGKRIIEKNTVRNLPQEWNENFHLSHLNMSFDEPELITLRIKRTKDKADYTFLHDWFGNTFQYIGPDLDLKNHDIVKLNCSPYAMVNWALQYSDRVEVLKPETVRNKIKEKIKALNNKYNG